MHRVACLLITLLLAAEASAETRSAASIAGLRERGMLDLAEREGRQLWGEKLPDRERADLAIQLAMIYTEQALAAAPDAREPLWTKADGACAALIDSWPDNPRRRLVEVQRALVLLARGVQSRQSQELAAAPVHLRAANRQLASIAEGVDRELVARRLRATSGGSPDDLSIEDLESLESHLAYHLARTERQAGLCRPAGTPDRDDALLQASKRLTPLVRRTPANKLIWDARVEFIACQRELGNPQSAQKLIDEWLKDNPPQEIVALFAAELATLTPTAPTAPGADNAPAITAEMPPDAAMNAAASARAGDRFAAAAEQYRQFALANPSKPQAAEAHRLAILCTADLLRQTAPTGRPSIAQSYEGLLQEHLRTWPSAATADDVRMWLGRLLAGRRDWPTAVAVLREIRPASDLYADTVRLVAEGYDQQLRQFPGDDSQHKQNRARLLAAATQYLQPIITGADNRWPNPWSDVQQEAATALARLHVRHAEPSSPYAPQLLSAALRGTSPTAAQTSAQSQWQTTAQALLVAALARNGKPAEAHAIAKELTGAPPDVTLETLVTVAERIPHTTPDVNKQREYGELAMTLVRLVDTNHTDLDAASLARLNDCRAAALAAIGDRAAALAQYAALASDVPDNGQVQERFAALLAESSLPEELRQALARWQLVEARSRRGGDRWRRARWARIDLLTRLGNTIEAEKLTRLTRLLYPDWDPAPTNAN